MLRQIRARWPDTLMALQQVPQALRAAVRDATQGGGRLQVQDTVVAQLRAEIRRSDARRDTAIAAAVLWLSGLVWLAFATRNPWLGWSQMTAAIGLFVWSRSFKARGE
jgi:hypothetical protein